MESSFSSGKKSFLVTENEIKIYASDLLKRLGKRRALALTGELGAGKTRLTQEIARLLGIDAQVRSPSFVLINVYQTHDKLFQSLCHCDAYRIQGADDAQMIGLDEYLTDQNTLTIIEWAENVWEALYGIPAIFVTIKYVDETTRKITEDYDNVAS